MGDKLLIRGFRKNNISMSSDGIYTKIQYKLSVIIYFVLYDLSLKSLAEPNDSPTFYALIHFGQFLITFRHPKTDLLLNECYDLQKMQMLIRI